MCSLWCICYAYLFVGRTVRWRLYSCRAWTRPSLHWLRCTIISSRSRIICGCRFQNLVYNAAVVRLFFVCFIFKGSKLRRRSAHTHILHTNTVFIPCSNHRQYNVLKKKRKGTEDVCIVATLRRQISIYNTNSIFLPSCFLGVFFLCFFLFKGYFSYLSFLLQIE